MGDINNQPRQAVPAATVSSTSLITILSSDHGRLRRQQRCISKRDLQAAVRYGTRKPGFPCPRTGARRWLYTFADVVYVTDDTGTQEITTWPTPGAGFDIPLVEITPEQQSAHERACHAISTRPASWTSHSVVVVDQSGSMRTTDVSDGATRSDAVWVTLAISFVLEQLESGSARATDVITVIGLNENATVLIDRKPVDWVLFNSLVTLLRTSEPKQASSTTSGVSPMPLITPVLALIYNDEKWRGRPG